MALRAILLVAPAAFLFAGLVRADTLLLTGSNTKTQDATSQAEIIFVGKVTDKGMVGDPTAKGWIEYFHVSVTVLQILQLHGTIDSKIKVTLGTQWSSKSPERPPKVDHSYIFFVHRDNGKGEYLDPFGVLKLVDATDGDIAAVKNLIAQLPKF